MFICIFCFCFSSRRLHTSCALVTGVQTCALPILSAEIEAAQAAGDPDLGDTYYWHWLKALEGLVLDRTDLTAERPASRRDALARAAQRAPHGEPILLPEDARAYAARLGHNASARLRSDANTSGLQSLMRVSSPVFCLKT